MSFREYEIRNKPLFTSMNYPKYVVTLDRLATGNENGVRIVHLEDFLLADTW